MKKEKYYCGGKRDKTNFQDNFNFFSNCHNSDFRESFFQEKNVHNNCKCNESDKVNNLYDETENYLTEKILELIEEFEEKEVPYNIFLNCRVPNFLNLKKYGMYDKLLTQFKKTKRRAVILRKGFTFSKSFNRWILDKKPNLYEQIKQINENFEVVKAHENPEVRIINSIT